MALFSGCYWDCVPLVELQEKSSASSGGWIIKLARVCLITVKGCSDIIIVSTCFIFIYIVVKGRLKFFSGNRIKSKQTHPKAIVASIRWRFTSNRGHCICVWILVDDDLKCDLKICLKNGPRFSNPSLVAWAPNWYLRHVWGLIGCPCPSYSIESL